MTDQKALPMKVTFYSAPFTDEYGTGRTQSVSVTVENGDFLGIIDAVRADGGVVVRDPDLAEAWYIPWPPAAIKVTPAI
jgi:hypothetical protein